MTVIDALGQSLEVLLYKKDMLGAPQKPSLEYLNHIARGAEARGLPPGYVDALRSLSAKKAAYPVPIPRRGEGGDLRATTCLDCTSLVATAPLPAAATGRG